MATGATSSAMISNQDISLLELLDRLLYKGVVVRGDLTISVADVDLVYLQLNVLLTSVAKMQDIAQWPPVVGSKEGL